VVRTAVVPVAGLGTRFLPATKSVPKEMLPIVDRPSIQYIVEESVRNGIGDVLLDPWLVMLPGEIGRGDVMPADARDGAALPGEARAARRHRVPAGKGAGDEGFDGVGFVEGHDAAAPSWNLVTSDCVDSFRCLHALSCTSNAINVSAICL
jgi:hypothetical protein